MVNLRREDRLEPFFDTPWIRTVATNQFRSIVACQPAPGPFIIEVTGIEKLGRFVVEPVTLAGIKIFPQDE
jgi:hypothetical protein